jgi:exopolyphosphatase/guanosine-5'-triphosphate,3'-diphosphate pyrophosphatase
VANAAGISSPAVSWPVVTGRAVTGAPALRKGPFVSRELRRKALRPWIARLAAMPARERAGHPGVSAHRARHILAGSVVAYELMHRLDLDVLSICPWALREGLLLRQLERYQPVLGNAVWIPWRAPGQPQTDSRAGGSDKIAALTPQPRVVDLAAVSALV